MCATARFGVASVTALVLCADNRIAMRRFTRAICYVHNHSGAPNRRWYSASFTHSDQHAKHSCKLLFLFALLEGSKALSDIQSPVAARAIRRRFLPVALFIHRPRRRHNVESSVRRRGSRVRWGPRRRFRRSRRPLERRLPLAVNLHSHTESEILRCPSLRTTRSVTFAAPISYSSLIVFLMYSVHFSVAIIFCLTATAAHSFSSAPIASRFRTQIVGLRCSPWTVAPTQTKREYLYVVPFVLRCRSFCSLEPFVVRCPSPFVTLGRSLPFAVRWPSPLSLGGRQCNRVLGTLHGIWLVPILQKL